MGPLAWRESWLGTVATAQSKVGGEGAASKPTKATKNQGEVRRYETPDELPPSCESQPDDNNNNNDSKNSSSADSSSDDKNKNNNRNEQNIDANGDNTKDNNNDDRPGAGRSR